ncbi:hypothetical protein H072_11113 [Dactylellina haptotyla CBS 200.50]|uniref:carboxypeptidase C n=1 Tax=Dactylellina haptotyla (strain CBS 200.50) TaxID=1284197 RepID=S8A2V9_DACHA|nr:hypothetical protein H072_11113 [Dactylellina haptotyla CBS 200.50]
MRLIISVSCLLALTHALPAPGSFPISGVANNYTRRSDDFWDFHVSGESAGPIAKRDTLLHHYSLRGVEPNPKELKVDDVKQYSGFFESRNKPKEDPIILWLNGGPGSSSLVPIFGSLGPSKITTDGKLKKNKNSWKSQASVIFLDQPVNVGFSYGKTVGSTADSARDAFAFLKLFFTKFPEYSKLPFHIHGISYGGHYVPALAEKILSEQSGINLKSISIANGWTDPLIQYGSFEKMACGKGGGDYKAFFDKAECEKLQTNTEKCKELVQKCYGAEEAKRREPCTAATSFCESNLVTQPMMRTGVNQYDVREKPSKPKRDLSALTNKGNHSARIIASLTERQVKRPVPAVEQILAKGSKATLPSALSAQCLPIKADTAEENRKLRSEVEKFLSLPKNLELLGAEGKKYRGCTNTGVAQQFAASGDYALPLQRSMPLILKHIPVLIYAGDADYACNWIGNLEWTEALEWPGQAEYKKAQLQKWKAAGKKAGMAKSARRLSFVKVAGAGHTADVHQPEVVLELLNNFIKQGKV